MAGAVSHSCFSRFAGAWAIALAGAATPALGQGMGPTPGPAPVPTPATSVESAPLGTARGPVLEGPAAGSERPGSSSGGGWRTAWSLAGVIGLIVVLGGAARVVSRRGALGAGGRSPSGLMEVLGRYPVARGTTLVLLRLERRVLLLSQSSGGRLGAGAQFTTLCEITDPEEVASILVKARDADGDSAAERFRTLLSRFDRGLERSEERGRGRRVARGTGDRAELWDDGRLEIPVVDLTIGAPGQGAVGALRQRLASLRGSGGGA